MAPWAPATTPYDDDGGAARGGCWADDLEEFLGGGGDGIAAALRSADGATWEAAGATPWDGGPGLNAAVRAAVLGLYVAVGTPGITGDPAIATAPDGSTAFTGITNPFTGPGSGVAAAVRASDGAILIAGQNADGTKMLAISDDDTTTWALYAPLALGGFPAGVTVRPSDDLILFVGEAVTFPDAATSSDGGSSWNPTDPGGLVSVSCATRDSDDALVVGGVDSDSIHQFGFVSVSTDDGASWSYSNPFGDGSANDTSRVGSVAVRQSDGAIIVFGFTVATSGDPFIATVGISLDDGATWSLSYPLGLVHDSSTFGMTLRASDEAILCLPYDNFLDAPKLAISTNSGSSWTVYDMPIIAGSIRVRDSDDLIVIGGSGSGAAQTAVSADGGTTWTDIVTVFAGPYTGVAGLAIRASDDLLIATGADALGTEQVAVSSDSGASWSAIDPGPFSTAASGKGFVVACKQSTGALIIGSGQCPQTIATSPDGVTFTPVTSPFDGGQVCGLDYSPGEDRWIASGWDYTFTAVVAYSDDGGATWTTVTNPMDVSYVSSGAPSHPRVYRDEDTSTWWLLGQTTGGMSLARSDDNGLTWTEVSSPLDPVAGVGAAWGMIRVGSVLGLCGIDNTLTKQACVSEDDGATWQFDANPSPFDASTAAYGFAYSPTIPRAVVFGNNPS